MVGGAWVWECGSLGSAGLRSMGHGPPPVHQMLEGLQGTRALQAPGWLVLC